MIADAIMMVHEKMKKYVKDKRELNFLTLCPWPPFLTVGSSRAVLATVLD